MKRFFAFVTIFALLLCAFNITPKAQGEVYEYYKSQLNADEQTVYQAFITASKSPAGECEIPTLSTIQYSFTTSTPITTQQQLTDFVNNNQACKDALSKLNLYFKNAIHALAMDHPEIYWLDNSQLGKLNYGYSSKGTSVSVVDVVVSIPKPEANPTQSLNKVNEKLKSIGATGTDIEKVKAIHDWLCNNVQYIDGSNAHDLYGSLFNGKAVCQGYAEAFKAACDYYGIKCVCVKGDALNSKGQREAHMWNYVLINNTWYAVDVTWDDQGKNIYYDYFLAGKNTVADHFDDKKFTVSHIADGHFGGAGQKEFNYPTLSDSGYSINNPTAKPTQKPVQNNATAKPTEKPTETNNVQATQTATPTIVTGTETTNAPQNEPTPATTDSVENSLPTHTTQEQQPSSENNSSTVIIIACAGIGVVVVASVVAMIIRKKQ